MITASSPSKNLSAPVRSVSLVKIVVLGGGQGVGCSAFVRAFVSGAFDPDADTQQSSVVEVALGAKFYSKMLLSKNDTIRFQIWDVPSAAAELLAPLYYASANICFVCFDLSRPKTLALAQQTLKRISSQETPNTVSLYVLVGCKRDLLDSGEARILKDAGRVAEAQGCHSFVSVSAKCPELNETSVQHIFLSSALVKLRKGSSRFLRPPDWVPDSRRSACVRCSVPFTATKRRHHCRNCADIYCSACANVYRPLPRFGIFEPVRICQDCSELLDGAAN